MVVLCFPITHTLFRIVPEMVKSLEDSAKGADFSFWPQLTSNQVRLAQKKNCSLEEKFLGAFGGMVQWLTEFLLDKLTKGGKKSYATLDGSFDGPSTKNMTQLNFIDACLHCFPYSIERYGSQQFWRLDPIVGFCLS